ncbi:MAG: hypothetical protein U9N63_05050 [Pseudomonadota bacterium]|nr:hypothetical protein [Pseudomonadota bacterium]
MEMTIYNPQIGRNETLDITIDKTNTTWFDDSIDGDGIYLIADIKIGLLIQKSGYSNPILFYGLTRAKIDYNPQAAKTLLKNIHSVAEDAYFFFCLQDN